MDFVNKILMVFGTRPEAIKLAPLIRALQACPEQFNIQVCVTAQHRQMLDQVLGLFEIQTDFDLNIMQTNQSLPHLTALMLQKIGEILRVCQPDLVLVQGDTTTALVASLAAFYERIPVGHIEAGLRTYNLYSPYPEELNRQIISKIARYHFVPTESSRYNLLQENIPDQAIVVTGNTVIDALFWVIGRIKTEPDRRQWLETFFTQSLGLDLTQQRWILVTGHRRESFGQGFESISWALREIAEQRSDISIVYPVHMNPNVRDPVNRILGKLDRVHLIEPLEYEQFVYLMSRVYLILTDSGGIQEEAPSLGKPVLLMRDTTERPEAVAAGTVKLVGTVTDNIISGVVRLLDNPDAYACMAKAHNPYGDGQACPRIVAILKNISKFPPAGAGG